MPLTGLVGRNGVSPVLRRNIDDLPFLINGTPQVLELTVDCQVHLIQVPGTSNWPAAPTQSFGICAFSHHELDTAITQAEANTAKHIG
jgi:hypothetical protein